MTILITNDDGIASPGIHALESAMSELDETIVVAPDRDNSAVSHAITMTRPLRLTKHAAGRYSVDGTPTDCVVLGLNKVLTHPPRLVVSGINLGSNLGDDLHYSGTVSAAIEAAMHGIPAIAFSAGDRQNCDFSAAIPVAQQLAKQLLQQPLPPQNLLNVNFPKGTSYKGIRLTRQGRHFWQDSILETNDPRGSLLYWIGGGTPHSDKREGTDVHAFNESYVSITPIQLDFTNHTALNRCIESWNLEEKK